MYNRRAITLLEIIIVLLVISLLAVAGASRIDFSNPPNLAAAGQRLLIDLGNARRLAMAEHRVYEVSFGRDYYIIRYVDDQTSALTHLPDPHTGRPEYRSDFSAGKFRGVLIEGVDFNGTSAIRFGSFGAPFDASGAVLENDGYVELRFKGRSFVINVAAQTGAALHE